MCSCEEEDTCVVGDGMVTIPVESLFHGFRAGLASFRCVCVCVCVCMHSRALSLAFPLCMQCVFVRVCVCVRVRVSIL